MKTNYFKHCKSLDEVKSEYKKLMQHWLPTVNTAGEPNIVSVIEKQYLEISYQPAFKQLSKEIQEEFLLFPNVVKELVRIELVLEICGSWVWITGNTFNHTDKLKELGLKFSPSKKMWYYRPKWSKATNSAPMSIEYIRNRYGSDTVEKEFVFDKPPYKEPVEESKQRRAQL